MTGETKFINVHIIDDDDDDVLSTKELLEDLNVIFSRGLTICQSQISHLLLF